MKHKEDYSEVVENFIYDPSDPKHREGGTVREQYLNTFGKGVQND